MQFQPTPKGIASLISRRMQVTFFVGLFLGIILGWLFSGLVGAVMRFGLLAVLMIPLILALIFWWKLRQTPVEGNTTIVTWKTGGLPDSPDMERDLFGSSSSPGRRIDQDVIDLEELKRERGK